MGSLFKIYKAWTEIYQSIKQLDLTNNEACCHSQVEAPSVAIVKHGGAMQEVEEVKVWKIWQTRSLDFQLHPLGAQIMGHRSYLPWPKSRVLALDLSVTGRRRSSSSRNSVF